MQRVSITLGDIQVSKLNLIRAQIIGSKESSQSATIRACVDLANEKEVVKKMKEKK